MSDDNVTQPPVAEAPAEEAPQNGVLVLRIEHPDGSISTEAVPQGDVKATEIETILGLALIGWRAKVGLGR